MADNMREDPIGRTVHLLNLRDSSTRAEEARRATKTPAKLTTSSFGTSPMASLRAGPASSPTLARPRTAGAGPTSDPKLNAISAIPFSTGPPAEAAAALVYFQTLERQRDEAVGKNRLLEEAVQRLLGMFSDHVAAVEASVGPLSQFFQVVFGPGHIGMILTSDDAGQIEVAELRDDRETGRPLLAKASGKIFVGDHVLAVNDRLLARFGPPTPEQVAAEFRSASRPMTVLFKRNAEARLRAALGDA